MAEQRQQRWLRIIHQTRTLVEDAALRFHPGRGERICYWCGTATFTDTLEHSSGCRILRIQEFMDELARFAREELPDEEEE